MKTVYYGQKVDLAEMRTMGSIFLAGPTPRDSRMQSWRPDALAIIQSFGFEGVVFVPEHDMTSPRDDKSPGLVKEDLWEWEQQALEVAHVIAFWVPRALPAMPGFTTNIEFGMWMTSGKVVFGAPHDACDVGYMRYVCGKQNIKQAQTLPGAMHLAVLKVAIDLRNPPLREARMMASP